MEQNNNLINNYKGVMLCSRPNQAHHTQVQKPFCGRVVNRDQLGLVPTKDLQHISHSPRKPRLQILDRHKEWLNKFKKNVQKKKNQIEQSKKQQQQKFKKIRQQAQIDRQRSKKMKQQYNQTATNVMNILNDEQPLKITSNQLTPENLNKLNKINQIRQTQSKSTYHNKQQPNNHPTQIFKKKKKQSKPLWAQTQQQIQKHQQQQVDELLDFFTTNHVQDYAQDNQVKDILSNLKQKIQKLQQEEDWKEKQLDRIKQRKEELRKRKENNNQNDDDDDKVTHFSGQSEGRSVASQKAQQKIQQLKAKKKQQQQWDKYTVSQKSSISGIDQKIAKNIADEVLRNYPNLRGVHSNVSIRKLLQQQAAKVMNQPIARPVITTIVREKQKIDANNLPYLHRNPAI